MPYLEIEGRPQTVARIRSLSRSSFNFEATSPEPHLHKLIAHVSVYERASKYAEEHPVFSHDFRRPAPTRSNQTDSSTFLTDLATKHDQRSVTVSTQAVEVDDDDDEWN